MSAPLNTVTWWEIPTGDLDSARSFYGAVFGWTFAPFGDDDTFVAVMSGDEMIGGLFQAVDGEHAASGTRLYVNVEDIEGCLSAVEPAGGSVVKPRTEIGDDMGWWAELRDPSGFWLGLCSSRPPAE